MQEMDIEANDEQISELMGRLDTNADGTIDYRYISSIHFTFILSFQIVSCLFVWLIFNRTLNLLKVAVSSIIHVGCQLSLLQKQTNQKV